MGKYIISCLLSTLLWLPLWAQPAHDPDTAGLNGHISDGAPLTVEQLWDKANTAYINSSYGHAIALYDTIMSRGEISYKLYYNLANAYFKSNEIGRSILYYNKALQLAPTDGDIQHNLAVANTYVKDKIEQVPEFFVERWIRSLRMSLSCNTWTVISLGLLALVCVWGIVYLLSGKLSRRKTGFYCMVLSFMLFMATTVFALSARRHLVAPDEGIVMITALPVKSSPDRSSKDLFVIHEGTKVAVVGTLQNWREVVLADGKKGWVEISSIEMI